MCLYRLLISPAALLLAIVCSPSRTCVFNVCHMLGFGTTWNTAFSSREMCRHWTLGNAPVF